MVGCNLDQCDMALLCIINIFFSPIAFGMVEKKCTGMLVLNIFLWLFGVIPGNSMT